MLHPRHSRFSLTFTGNLATQNLATGKSFGYSTLNVDRQAAAEFPTSENVNFITDTTTIIDLEPTGLSTIEVLKLVLLSIRLWYLLGVNSCLNSIGAISSLRIQTAR
jgi:hypothetical protein